MLHVDEELQDLLGKLEATRLVCRESDCAQRYLTHDAMNAIHQATHQIDDADNSDYHRCALYALVAGNALPEHG